MVIKFKESSEMVKYIENYALYQQIGSGVYGKVFRSINNIDKKEYAIKVIPILKFRENKKLQQCTVNQINILTNIEPHPHIIRYYDMLKTSNNFYFIYEYCNGGTLDNLLLKQGKLSQTQTLAIFKQLLEAFQILNKYNIMHRDMKPDNIFFHNGIIKLGDFGFCKNLSSADQMTRTMLGSPIYMAPQVLKGQIYSNKADIWSLGVVLYEMLFGECPFQSNSIAKLIQVLDSKDLSFPGQISPFLKNLISKMLTKDPLQRMGWMEIFQIKINADGKIQSAPHMVKLEDAKQSYQDGVFSSLKSITMKQPQQNSIKQQYKSNNSPTSPFKKGKPSNNDVMPMIKIEKPSANQQQKQMISKDHKNCLQGIKLAMQLYQSKIPNNMGFSYLILVKTTKNINDLIQKCNNTQIREVLQAQVKQLKIEQDNITSKMFAYQLKGLEDWKKYLRGKFFEEEKTLGYWYKMITYLNGLINNPVNQTSKMMVETIKSILY